MILTAMQAYNALLALRQSDGKERRPKERKSIKAHKETIPYEVKFLMEKYHLGFEDASELLNQELGHDQKQRSYV